MEKYAIIDAEKNTRFAQQDFESLEAANARRDHLAEKFNNRFSLVVVRVDEKGAFHKLAEKASEKSDKK